MSEALVTRRGGGGAKFASGQVVMTTGYGWISVTGVGFAAKQILVSVMPTSTYKNLEASDILCFNYIPGACSGSYVDMFPAIRRLNPALLTANITNDGFMLSNGGNQYFAAGLTYCWFATDAD